MHCRLWEAGSFRKKCAEKMKIQNVRIVPFSVVKADSILDLLPEAPSGS